MDWLKTHKLLRHCSQEIASPAKSRIAMTIMVILLSLSTFAQISRIEYFWNNDPGFGNGIALPITPGDSVAQVFSFSTTGLKPGVHTLYLRSQDSLGKWSVFSKKAIIIEESVFPIAAAEYFFDTDPGFGNGTPINITPGDSIQLTDTMPTNSLAPGIHTLHVRTRDANGKWSVYSKRLIHIQQPIYPIAEAEYFIDNDPGFGNATPIPITPGDSIDLVGAINTTSLSPGIHTVYIRVKSSHGEWSVFSKRPIFIKYPEAPPIVAAEYFVDNDPGIGDATPIPLTQGDSVLTNFQVPTGSLGLGIHMVYVRVKYLNTDQWSVYSKQLIYIDNPAEDSIIAAEYFVDTDPGFGNATAISITSGDSIITSFSVPTNSLLVGPHRVYVRVLDQQGRWSVYSKDSFYVDNFDCPIYGNGEIEIIGDTCQGTEIVFKDKTTSNSGVNSDDFTREWDFFDDTIIDFKPDSVVNYNFDQTGTYTVKLTVYETNNSVCQEIVYKTFTIRRVDTTSSNVGICEGDSLFVGGSYQTTSGTYYDTYNNRYGCDSVHITHLTVTSNVTPSVTITVNDDSICSGTTALFTAVPVNGGNPYFTWKVNGGIVGQGPGGLGWNTFGISTLADGDVVTCDLTSSITCTTDNPVTSNAITMQVTPSVSASITIEVDTNNICYGTPATFTIVNLTNEGDNPQYNWYVDNVLAQSGGTTFTSSTLNNGDLVRCRLTSDAVCVDNSPVNSNVITMHVSPNGLPAVSVSPSVNNVCYGTPVTFTAPTSFGGNNPHYQWFLNDSLVQSGSSNTYANDSLDDGDEVKCVLTSDYQCRLADTDTSNTVTMNITYYLPVSASLNVNANDICRGTDVTFSASVTNGGGSPNYEFFVNGNSVQNGIQYHYHTSSLNDNDSVWVVVTSSIPCAINNPDTSNKIYMTVVQYDTTSVSITATEDSICEGTPVTFTANAINPGPAPNYRWKINGLQVQYGAADTFSTPSLSDGSVVTCELYGDHQCVTPNPAVSNGITMSVTDTVLPAALLQVPENVICQGTQVDFNVSLLNEGSNPLVEWLLNNDVVQTGGLSYSNSTFEDFDVVQVRLTADLECPSENPVLSNQVVMTVIDSVTPSAFIYHGPDPACPGSLISVFTAASSGGDAPTFEFRVNGNLVQSGPSSQYTSGSFNDGDVVQVTMFSNAECIRNTVALSNYDTIRFNDFITADVSIQATSQDSCAGDTLTFEATPVNGGSNPAYTWRVNNVVVQSSGNNTFTSAILQDNDSVYCEMNSSLPCVTNNPVKSNAIHIQLQDCSACDTNWVTGSYSDCSVECGGGVQTRQVWCEDCQGNILADSLCPGSKPPTTQVCNTQACPVDCQLGPWSDWSACDTTCGGGLQFRTREILVPPANGGLPCGDTIEYRACNTQSCCDNNWVTGSYGNCTAECGGGIQTRQVWCEDCQGNILADSLCPGYKPPTTQVCNTQACPVDCQLGPWSDWSACDTTCGGGLQFRTREILVLPANGGLPCGDTIEYRACNTQACPGDCQLGPWSDWSACDTTCGGGLQFRTREILVPPSNGGLPCGDTIEYRACNTQACPVDCQLGPWSDWSICDTSCGGGQQFRTREILVPPSNGGLLCGDTIEYRSCNTQACPVDCQLGPWSDWSACDTTCGGGLQFRTREILISPSNGGLLCGDTIEYRACNTQPCDSCHCDDGDPCTMDYCIDGICQHDPIPPQLAFSIDTACVGEATHIINHSTGVDLNAIYQFDLYNDGTIDATALASDLPTDSTLTIPISGNIAFKVIVTNPGGCSDTLTGAITIRDCPGACIDDGECDDGDPCTIDHCFDGECIHGVDSLSVLIDTSLLPGFCQGNGVTLTAIADNVFGQLIYAWSTGDTTRSITTSTTGTYSVTVTDAIGCQASATDTITLQDPSSWLSSYTILASKEIKLHHNVVNSGGVGVSGAGNKAKMHGSTITAPTTFVKAPLININGGGMVSNQIIGQANVPLPPFETNPFGNGPDLNIPDNTSFTATGSNYGKIKVGKNSTLIFSQPVVNMEDLKTEDGATLKFAPCSKIRIAKSLDLKDDNIVNPDSSNVTFYVEEHAKIGSGSRVIAGIYAKKELKVKKSEPENPTNMTGLFIAEKVDAKDFTNWYWNTDCDPSCQPLVDSTLACICQEGIEALTVEYLGQPGADINVHGRDGHRDLLASFTDVQPGDLLLIDASAIGNGHLEKTTYFEVVGWPDIEIATSCGKSGTKSGSKSKISGPTINDVIGDFRIDGYIDVAGNLCNMDPLPTQKRSADNGPDESVLTDDLGEGGYVKAYPNPFMQQLTIEFSIPTKDQVVVEIFAITGEKVAELFNDVAVKDRVYKLNFHPENLSGNMFIYRMQTSDKAYFNKVIYIKN